MGYMGLESWSGSDLAADAVHNALAALAKSLKKALKEKGSDFNTEGMVNVALFFEEFIVPLTQQYAEAYSDELNEVARKVAKKLEKLI
jgi:hypothetical protein